MKQQKQNRHFGRDQLVPWGALFFALLVLGGFIAYSLYQKHERIEKFERERLSTQAKVIDENLARQLDAIYLALEGIRRELPLWKGKSGKEQANRHLRTLVDAMPGIRTFLIADETGTIIACNHVQAIGRNIIYRDWFQGPLKDKNASKLYISPPFKTLMGHFAINAGLMIPGAGGEFKGVVAAALDPEYFKILLGSVIYATDMWAALAHGDGKQFLMVPDRKGMAGMNLDTPGSFFTRHRESGLAATVMTGIVHATGEERLMALRTIRPSSVPMDKPLVVAVGRNISDLFADWHREVFGKNALFGVLALAMSLTLYFYQRRQRNFDIISARYEASQRDSAERLKLATQAAGMGIWDFDLEKSQLTWDDEMFTIYGQSRENFSSTYDFWRSTVLPEDLEKVESVLHNTIYEGQSFDTSFRIRREDKEVRTIHSVARVHRNENGRAVRVIGINEDITHRQQEAEALRQNERFLKTLTDAIPGTVGYWTRDLHCTFANKRYQTRFGKSFEEMWGIHIQDFLGRELYRHNEPFIRRALLGENQEFLLTLTKPDGEIEHVRVNYVSDIDDHQIRGFYVLVTDVTELKQAQVQLEELNAALKQRTEEAEQASNSKSKFLATIAHEFRTPLSLLTSSTDILDRYGERLSKERRMEQNGHIRSAARQMSNLIDSVLSFNRLETGKPREALLLLNVGQICNAVATEVRMVWDDGHQFSATISKECGSALLDEILLRRVLGNLLTNAFRYTPSGGSVSLHVSRESNRLIMVITDSGIGIPQEDQTRIFDAFYRGGNVEARRGMGLGLSIVREALLQTGGIITLDSTTGAGTTARVEIPVVGEE